MPERPSPTPIQILEQPESIRPSHAAPNVDFAKAAELNRHGYEFEAAHGGLMIADAGRAFLACYRAGAT
jgi:hypothetical protein